jgi:hypothetical protein
VLYVWLDYFHLGFCKNEGLEKVAEDFNCRLLVTVKKADYVHVLKTYVGVDVQLHSFAYRWS